MQRAIRTLLIRECIEASELLILFSIHPPMQGFVKKEKQYAGESPTFSGLIQTAGQL